MMKGRVMKVFITTLLLTVCAISAIGQRKLAEDDPQRRQYTVKRAFQEASAGMRSSWSEKYLARLGDSAAPTILDYISSKPIADKDIEAALALVDMSFGNISLITHSSNRVPTNTIVLLEYLDK